MKKPAVLSDSFRPLSYKVDLAPEKATVIIIGDKINRPSHRITLHQKGLRVSQASIVRINKAEKVKLRIDRINHLQRAEELRLHTHDLLYPGRYEIELGYSLRPDILTKLKNSEFDRQSLPSIDEADSWAKAEVFIR